MIEDNILLITENEDIAKNVLSKLVLLRESDSIAVSNYKMAKKNIEDSNISIVIVHQKDEKDKTINFIKSIQSNNYTTILLVNDYDQDLILEAYDAGISDYFSINSESYEMLIRTVNCFKYQTLISIPSYETSIPYYCSFSSCYCPSGTV